VSFPFFSKRRPSRWSDELPSWTNLGIPRRSQCEGAVLLLSLLPSCGCSFPPLREAGFPGQTPSASRFYLLLACQLRIQLSSFFFCCSFFVSLPGLLSSRGTITFDVLLVSSGESRTFFSPLVDIEPAPDQRPPRLGKPSTPNSQRMSCETF